ncbi:MAG: hypothetical protein ACI4OL_04415 [Gemmiger sp.]
MRQRVLRALRLAALAACLAAVLAVPAFAGGYAEPGDYDEIESYTVTVNPRPNGSADITYDIQWQVVGGSANDYLSWVKIGLANEYVDELTVLTPDTIAGVECINDGGSYARVDFRDRYYAPDAAAAKGAESSVHFAFSVHQSHLFTLNDDGTADFVFTPGWFDDIVIDQMTVRWKSCEGITADNTGTAGEYLEWRYGPLGHGEIATVHVTVPEAVASLYDAELTVTAAAGEDGGFEIYLLILFVVIAFLVLAAMLRPARWDNGLGDDDYVYYSDGVHVVHLLPHQPPPAGYHMVARPAGFKAGGGSTRGGGASRNSGNHTGCACACACASSCACACACAGGGRAGCSAKNFYRIQLNFHTDKEE